MGRVATVVWAGFLATLVFGLDWKKLAEEAINSGRPVKGAIVLVVLVATLLFVAVRSVLGYARWRIQRELWRRDVERVRS
jgi:predicted membrane chloride channel (bestrophin family)